MANTKHKLCSVCNNEYPRVQLHSGASINSNLLHLIQKDYPDFDHKDFVCSKDLNNYRTTYITSFIKRENETLNQFENEVLSKFEKEELYVQQQYDDYDTRMTNWDKLADNIARFGGSWKFIGFFGGVILVWIIINAIFLSSKAFDPYPFILLNLILSCVAALQAPVIMMSQNRMEARDRMRAETDFNINMKAEIEIKIMHEKLDHLVNNQWEKLLEIQQKQLELMEELKNASKT